MNDSNVLVVSDREHATLLNALRFWAVAGRAVFPEYFEDQPAGPLDETQLEAFVERISTDVNLSILLTVEGGLVTHAFVPGASERICINVFDTDIEGVEEDHVEELQLPLLGIQSGTAYSVGRNIDAPQFLELLDRKWLADAQAPIPAFDDAASDVQTDLFLADDVPAAAAERLDLEPADA